MTHERVAHTPTASAPCPVIETVVPAVVTMLMPAGRGSWWAPIDPESSSIRKTLAAGSVPVNGGSWISVDADQAGSAFVRQMK